MQTLPFFLLGYKLVSSGLNVGKKIGLVLHALIFHIIYEGGVTILASFQGVKSQKRIYNHVLYKGLIALLFNKAGLLYKVLNNVYSLFLTKLSNAPTLGSPLQTKVLWWGPTTCQLPIQCPGCGEQNTPFGFDKAIKKFCIQ